MVKPNSDVTLSTDMIQLLTYVSLAVTGGRLSCRPICLTKPPGAPVGLPLIDSDVPVLVGRDREQRLLGGLIDTLKVSGGAMVIRGEAGMGKTSLLGFVGNCAKRHEVSIHVLRGTESEAVIPFAAITDLLWPFRSNLVNLPTIQREALEVCLALSAGPSHGPLAACAGALGVLASAAEQQAMVILIDDFQDLDPESRQILLFVARRLAAERLLIILTMRAEPDAPPRDTGLPVLSLTGLSPAECAELAARRRRRRRVRSRTPAYGR